MFEKLKNSMTKKDPVKHVGGVTNGTKETQQAPDIIKEAVAKRTVRERSSGTKQSSGESNGTSKVTPPVKREDSKTRIRETRSNRSLLRMKNRSLSTDSVEASQETGIRK